MPRFAIVGSALGLATMLALTTPTASVTTTRCEDIVTFRKEVEDANGIKYANGQCVPSKSPGAYYTKTGEKDANDPKSDRPWMCFSPDFDKKLWTNKEAQIQNFAGACIFAAFKSKVTPDDVEDCSNHLSHHPAVCAPGPSLYWGACWSSTSEQWKCIPNNDDAIPGFAKGDCKAQVVLHEDGTPTTSFYAGACRFKEEKVVKYRCDTVPGYDAGDAGTCGGGARFDNACFTLHKGANWQCFQKDQISTTPCDWTPLAGKKEFYKGACVFKGSLDYHDAMDANNLIKSVETSRNDASTFAASSKPAEKARLEAETLANAEADKEPRMGEEASHLRKLKWRWAENIIMGYLVLKTRFEDAWNVPENRAALVQELESKALDPGAPAKQYRTRAVEFAEVDYPDRRRTFPDYMKALEWLMLELNIQSRDDL